MFKNRPWILEMLQNIGTHNHVEVPDVYIQTFDAFYVCSDYPVVVGERKSGHAWIFLDPDQSASITGTPEFCAEETGCAADVKHS